MPPIFTILLIIAIAILSITLLKNRPHKRENATEKPSETTREKQIEDINLTAFYQKKWLFSYNEKDAFKKLKEITDNKNLILLSKVRLLDLIEPQKGNTKYKTLFYKIQAKHVDFVICDSKLVARYIIELDDSSHDQEERKKRDDYVDSALKNAGYKILHIRAIENNIIEKFLSE